MRGAEAVVPLVFVVVVGGAGCILTTSLSGLSGGAAADRIDAGANDAAMIAPNDAASSDGGTSVYAATVAADRPVLFWRLGEKETSHGARDSSKGLRDGTFLGAVQCGVEGALHGDPDTACRFDGTTSAVFVDAAGLVFAGNDPYSIEAWARPTSVTANHDVFSIAGHDVQNDGYLLMVDGKARVTSVRETNDGLVAAVGPVGALSAYQHVVGVYENRTLRLYLNGQLFDMSAATSPIPGVANIPFTVGADGSGHGQPFIGDIDEVAVYDYPLSAVQVGDHYRAGTGGE